DERECEYEQREEPDGETFEGKRPERQRLLTDGRADVGHHQHDDDRNRGHDGEAGYARRDEPQPGSAGREPELDEAALLVASACAGPRDERPERVNDPA